MCTLGLGSEEPDAYGERHVEATLAEVDILERGDEELRTPRRHELRVPAGRRRDHRRRPVERRQVPRLEALADERRRDAVPATDLEDAVAGTEIEPVDDRLEPTAHRPEATRRRPRAGAYPRLVTIRFCDDRGAHGFSWLVDPVRHEPALSRARELGEPVAVLQLLDRHNRDCAELAHELGVPHVVTPDALPGTPFEPVTVRESPRWRERALWWDEQRTLVVAEAVSANRFFRAGDERVGVHLLLRLTPPRDELARFEPEHLLLGHGEGLHGPDAAAGLREALVRSRTGLPRLALQLPALALDARRRRR